jgi:hypothetical protein
LVSIVVRFIAALILSLSQYLSFSGKLVAIANLKGNFTNLEARFSGTAENIGSLSGT